MTRVIHLTSAHPRYDSRIFLKMCSSLAAHNYDVSLIVADGLGNETKNNVNIIDVGAKTGGRLSRMTKTVQRVFATAKALDADIYHLHDPELIPIGLNLKRLGKTVIFDAHEDLPKQLLSKPYLGPVRLRMLSAVFAWFERYVCRRFDGIITATPFIRDKFLAINQRTIDINNFPLLNELDAAVPWDSKRAKVCYVGGIATIRGIREVIAAMDFVQTSVRLNLAGQFLEAAVEAEVKGSRGWQRVNELGFLNREGVRDVLGRSVAGLVTLHPVINYIDALPVKMFEYMSAGIPVIASNFPLWRNIIEGNDCGLCIDPMNPQAIAEAIDFLVSNPERAQQMGENGRKAVQEKYNWSMEEQKLFALYANLTKAKS